MGSKERQQELFGSPVDEADTSLTPAPNQSFQSEPAEAGAEMCAKSAAEAPPREYQIIPADAL